jgi:two-component system cell cycle sensor histidine kinase/response regulator CckA
VTGRTFPIIETDLAEHSASGAIAAWMDGLADGCLLTDRELIVLYINAAFATWLGKAPGAVIGRPLAEAFEAAESAPTCRVAMGALSSGRCQHADECAGGRWFQLRAHPVPEGVVLLRHEASGRQRDEELSEAARDCRLVLEQLPVIHWTVDTDLRIAGSIGSGLDALGLAEGETTGLTLYEFLRTDDPEYLPIRMHRRALEGVRVEYADFRWGRHFDVTLEPLRDRADQIIGIIGLAHDVSERHRSAEERSRLQEQLLLAQKRESLGVLAAGVAHDFNNLLSAIVGSAGLLLRELPAGGAPYESAALIKKAAERATEVTRQMLVYAGKSVLSRRPQNLNELIHDNSALLSAAVPRSVSLETRLADELPTVLVDSVQVQQVLMNLLMNAGEAAASQGATVTLATGTDTTGKTSMVFVEVSDSGCGIPPDVQSRVFDPFFTTKGRGRGLGLSAVQGIVHSHGGQIRLTSVPGQGTTFRVLLPAGETISPRSNGREG